MKKTWVEISCDNCGCADHYPPGDVDAEARANGWIITRKGNHYDSQECYKIHNNPQLTKDGVLED